MNTFDAKSMRLMKQMCSDATKHFLEELSIRSEADIVDKIVDYSLSEERLKVFTGLTWKNIEERRNMLTSLRNSHGRTQAFVTLLFKLKTGNSNKVIAAILGLE